jgi:tetratricopeptide (TPR) repeat protein
MAKRRSTALFLTAVLSAWSAIAAIVDIGLVGIARAAEAGGTNYLGIGVRAVKADSYAAILGVPDAQSYDVVIVSVNDLGPTPPVYRAGVHPCVSTPRNVELDRLLRETRLSTPLTLSILVVDLQHSAATLVDLHLPGWDAGLTYARQCDPESGICCVTTKIPNVSINRVKDRRVVTVDSLLERAKSSAPTDPPHALQDLGKVRAVWKGTPQAAEATRLTVTIHVDSGTRSLEHEQFDDATDAARKALDLDPGSGQARALLEKALAAQAKALDAQAKTQATDREARIANLKRESQLHLEHNEFEAAIEAARQALESAPSDAQGRFLLDRAIAAQTKAKEAAAEAREAELKDKVQLHLDTARSFEVAGSYSEAKTEIDRALALDSQNLPAQQLLAEINVKAERAKSQQRHETTLRYLEAGRAHLQALRYEDALVQYRKGLDFEPANRDLQAALDEVLKNIPHDKIRNVWTARNVYKPSWGPGELHRPPADDTPFVSKVVCEWSGTLLQKTDAYYIVSDGVDRWAFATNIDMSTFRLGDTVIVIGTYQGKQDFQDNVNRPVVIPALKAEFVASIPIS